MTIFFFVHARSLMKQNHLSLLLLLWLSSDSTPSSFAIELAIPLPILWRFNSNFHISFPSWIRTKGMIYKLFRAHTFLGLLDRFVEVCGYGLGKTSARSEEDSKNRAMVEECVTGATTWVQGWGGGETGEDEVGGGRRLTKAQNDSRRGTPRSPFNKPGLLSICLTYI